MQQVLAGDQDREPGLAWDTREENEPSQGKTQCISLAAKTLIPKSVSAVYMMIGLLSVFVAVQLGCGSSSSDSSPVQSYSVLVLASEIPDAAATTCETETGGTCLVSGCDPGRGPTKCDWGMCICQNATCTDAGGFCHPYTNASRVPAGSPKWFRLKIHFLYYTAPMAAVFRSDVLAALMTLAARSFCGRAKAKPTSFSFASDWADTMVDLELTGIGGNVEAVAYGVIKLAMYHYLQPIGMLLAWYAYSPLMGWVQWVLGLVVAVREVAYCIIITVGIFKSPHFLLFQPFTDEDTGKKIWFVTSPQVFVTACMLGGGEPAYLLVGLPSAVADFCAVAALTAGLWGWGAMWPALGVSYLLAFVSMPAMAACILFDLHPDE